MIWQFRKSKKHAWSYIFGTMHVSILPERLDQITHLISTVDAYYSEIDIDESQKETSIKSIFSSDNSISDSMRPKKYKKMRSILLKTFETDILPFDQLLPFLIMNQLSTNMLDQGQAYSMDQTLWNVAKNQNKIMGGLESTNSQIEVLQSIAWEDQRKQLIDLSKNVGKYRRFIFKMYEAYKMEDISTLYKMTNESLGKYKNLMLKDRNIKMTDKIFSNKEQGSFYAIGAAHLGGYNGMLRLLKCKGFELLSVE